MEGQLVEHGDLLSVCKQAQEGCVAKLEPKRELAIRLLISALQVIDIKKSPINESDGFNH